jgi:DNA-binding response OmpR family regulator
MRLLLCEDEIELSEALVEILKRNKYSVDAVYNGEEALDYIYAYEYDGIIMDIMMPKMDGITLLKILREKKINVPVLMLTAKAEIDDRVLGLDLGADDYLTKPFDIKELLARVRALTRRVGDKKDNLLEYGNIKLNRSSFELTNGSKSFNLANKEFQMLEMMMINPEQLISTEMFMEKIWGYDCEAEINVVWVYLSYLRKKLKELDADVAIKSTRNLGYSLRKI